MIVEQKVETYDKPLLLDCGHSLKRFELAYETYGKLNHEKDNAILICHTGTSNAHAAGRYAKDDPNPGWWDVAIGPARPFDTDRMFVVCSNILGGSGGSTGPSSIDPDTGRPYGLRFPVVTIGDMVVAQARLADRLGIERFHAIAGGSTGGKQVLEWIVRYPNRLSNAIIISSTPRTTAHNLGLWEVMRRAIMLDPAWNGGDYYDGEPPRRGLALVSMFGIMTWMSREIMEKRFGLRLAKGSEPTYTLEPEFAIQQFLAKLEHNAHKRFDANSAIYISKAIDYFDLTRGREDLSEAFLGFTGRTLLVSYRSDWRYPPEEVDQIRVALEKIGLFVKHKILDSDFGHGAFIYDAKGVGRSIQRFLAETGV